jgi:hypothetical protein
MVEYPWPLVYRAAAASLPSHCEPSANQTPSSILIGWVQKPPISPRMCQPVAGYNPVSSPIA